MLACNLDGLGGTLGFLFFAWPEDYASKGPCQLSLVEVAKRRKSHLSIDFLTLTLTNALQNFILTRWRFVMPPKNAVHSVWLPDGITRFSITLGATANQSSLERVA